MAQRVILHIGAPKTASTTLQRSLFARHRGIHYVGEEGEGWPTPEEAAVAQRLIFADDLFVPAEAGAKGFADQRLAAGDRTFVYSNGDIMTSRRPTACATRLHALLPDAHVVIVLRNQFTALPSYWANHGAFLKPAPPSHFRRFVALEDWLAWGVAFPEDTPVANFLYGEIAELYARLWGRERVHLFLFEEFVADRFGFVRRLASLLEIDAEQALELTSGAHERRRNSGRVLAWNRLYSRWLWGLNLPPRLPGRHALETAWQRFLAAGTPAKVEIPAAWRKRIETVYAAGNRRIVDDWGLDLARHDYPLSPTL